MAVRHAAGLSDLRKGPNTVTKAACARAWRSFWGGWRYARPLRTAIANWSSFT